MQFSAHEHCQEKWPYLSLRFPKESGIVFYAYDLSTRRLRQEFKASLSYIRRLCLKIQTTKKSL
jgi:hypothetical protein